jgi:hypothetical protein
MAVIETRGLLSSLSLYVAWVSGPKDSLAERHLVKGEYFAWREGLDVDLLDNMVIQTVAAEGLMTAGGPKRFEYVVTTSHEGLSVAQVANGKLLSNLIKSETSKKLASVWEDASTGLVFNVDR